MLIYTQNHWVSRSVTLVLGAFAAASVVFWVLKLSSAGGSEPVVAVESEPARMDPQALVKALGGGAAAPVQEVLGATPQRVRLVGVVSTPTQQGAALISLDGKPAKPYTVGATVEGGWTLRSVQPRRAVLAVLHAGQPPVRGEDLVLEMPEKPEKLAPRN